ncbi:NADPH-dependent FMN reductase [Hydrogenophaga sp.]|uniref:NADPH-dependent FMN reductase n=1 Tax=Hydrogenophaga sp. TaxID=1904254 RepID=UPI0035630EE9
MRFLALSGSLRRASVNSALLRAAARLAPETVEVHVYTGLGALPLFNPDDEAAPPEAVQDFWRAVAQADALVVASPEYAHGVTGTIKNALDWLVGFEPFAHKPVAVVNTSPRAHHADAALRETLTTMAACIVEAASVSIPLLGAHLDEEGMLASPESVAAIGALLLALAEGVAQAQAQKPGSPPGHLL